MLAEPEPLRNFRNRIASLGELTHGVTLEIVGEIKFAHSALLTSKFGKKASTSLRTIQLLVLSSNFRRWSCICAMWVRAQFARSPKGSESDTPSEVRAYST